MRNILVLFFTTLVAVFITGCKNDVNTPFVPPEPNYEGYKVYMNNLTPEQVGSIVDSGRYVGGWDHVRLAFETDNWTYFGRATSTDTFVISAPYEFVMILWERVGIKFDSFENLSSGASLGYDSSGSYVGYFYTDSNLMFDDPMNLILGPPDGMFATTNSGGSLLGGYAFFAFPGGFHGTSGNPQLFRVTFQDYR